MFGRPLSGSRGLAVSIQEHHDVVQLLFDGLCMTKSECLVIRCPQLGCERQFRRGGLRRLASPLVRFRA